MFRKGAPLAQAPRIVKGARGSPAAEPIDLRAARFLTITWRSLCFPPAFAPTLPRSALPFDLPPPVPTLEFTVSSHGMAKGISQADGPQAFPKFSLKSKGFQVGAQWKNLSPKVAGGEAQLFAGWSGKAAGFTLAGGVAYRILTDSMIATGNGQGWELNASVARKFGPLGFRVMGLWNRDDYGPVGPSLYIEGGPSLALPSGFSVSAAVGHRGRRGGVDYTSFNAGVSKTLVKKLILDLRYYDTDRNALGYVYAARAVGSVKMIF
jgi:hypothetical protein